MLVDMGDLPEPDTGVLSENLFSSTQPTPQPQPTQMPAPSIPPPHQPAPSPIILPTPSVGKPIKSEVSSDVRPEPPQPSANTAPLIPPLLKVSPDVGPTAGSGASYRGVLSSVDATSHLYTSKTWSSMCPSDMQAVMPMDSKLELKSETKASEPKPSTPPEPRDVFANLQGGGSLLQKISGKKPEVKDTSIVSGLPRPVNPAPVINTRPNNGSIQSKFQQSYPYHPFTQEDMRVISHDAITANAKMEEEKSHSLKRKLEETVPNGDT